MARKLFFLARAGRSTPAPGGRPAPWPKGQIASKSLTPPSSRWLVGEEGGSACPVSPPDPGWILQAPRWPPIVLVPPQLRRGAWKDQRALIPLAPWRAGVCRLPRAALQRHRIRSSAGTHAASAARAPISPLRVLSGARAGSPRPPGVPTWDSELSSNSRSQM